MRTTIKYTMGKPRLQYGTYCGPQCGAGCTKQQFDAAKAAAEELATTLGKHWEPVVFENLGWHSEARLGTMVVSKFGSGNAARYHFATGTSPQFTGDGRTPEAAVTNGLGEMRRNVREVEKLYARFVAALWPGFPVKRTGK